jgi:hypothetical protein
MWQEPAYYTPYITMSSNYATNVFNSTVDIHCMRTALLYGHVCSYIVDNKPEYDLSKTILAIASFIECYKYI